MALLVGLGGGDAELKAGGATGEVHDVDRDQFGAAQGSAHPDRQQCPVANTSDAVAFDRAEHVAQHIAVGGALSGRGLAPLVTADARMVVSTRIPPGWSAGATWPQMRWT
jgi:hypothetical protein